MPEKLPYPLTADQYLTTRVDDQIGWYDAKTKILKQRYRWLKGLTIVLGAAIPVLIALSNADMEWLKYVAALCGALITTLEGLSGMLKDKEVMLQYRLAKEALLREKMLFLAQAGPYAAQQPDETFRLFVANSEIILGAENNNWAVSLREKSTEEQDKT